MAKFKHKVDAKQAASATVERNRTITDDHSMGGVFHVEVRDKDGKLKYDFDCKNGITNVGKNHILGVEFHGDTPITTWYIGLVDDSGFSAFAAGDTMSSHSGWSESVAYSESTRNAWGPGASSGQSITNASPVTFTASGSATIHGIFVTSGSAKSGTSGTLWSTGAFASPIVIATSDTIKVTYTVSC